MSIFSKFWLSVRTVWDYTIDGVFSVFCCCWQKHIPPVSNPIVLESATTLAEKIRNQQLKVESVVTAFIERINEVNGVLNAIVANRFDEALKEARQIDRDIEDGKITAKEFSEKPLLGIPFTTKESTSCKGFPHTLGLKCRKDIIANQDAPAVTRMKNAGAILIGVTNIPELIWQESFNTVYGRTNNPYSTTRTAGGSSGGEASNVSACGCPVGIGTDLGGSIRIPCFMCGVFGHKISAGLATTKGTYFQEDDDPDTMGTVGPITKFAADLAPVIKVLVGEHISKLSLDIEVNVREIQIYYNLDSSPTYSPLRKEIKELHKRVISHFNDISSCKPEKIDCDDIEYGAKLWQYWLTQEQNTDFKRDLKNRKGKASTFKEVLKFLTCLSEHSMSTPAVLVGELLPQAKEDWARDVTQQMREELIDKLGSNGVLLYPSAPFPASYHYTAFFRPFNFGYFGIWNVLKLPVTQVPLGLSKEGLPLGIQVVAGPCQDHLCIAVAKELENAFGGYVPPFEL